MDKPGRIPEIKKAETSAVSRAEQRAQEAAKRTAAARKKILYIALTIAVLINLALAYLLHGNMVEDVRRKFMSELTERQAELRVDGVEKYLEQLQKTFQKVATQPELVTALSENDPAKLTQLQAAIKNQFKAVLAVHLTPVGKAKLQREGATPIRFAELDLIRRAERGEDSYPEVAVIDDQQQLHWIVALTSDTEHTVVGTLMITQSADALIDAFNSTGNAFGRGLLVQKFSDGLPLNIVSNGTGNAAAGIDVAVDKSNWTVRFTPSDLLVNEAEELPALWLVLISLTSVVGLVIAVLASRFFVKTKIDVKSVGGGALADSVKVRSVGKNPEEQLLANPMYQNQDILDISVIEEDNDILGLNTAGGKKTRGTSRASASETVIDVPVEIFRSYDIRGIVDQQLTPALAEKIGQAVGSEAIDQGEVSVIVARDGRTHSEVLGEALIKGILRTGCHVIDIGVVPTPVLYFAAFHLPDSKSGVMVTASHNPAEYNGFKMVINGVTLADDAVMEIRSRIMRQQFHRGQGSSEMRNVLPDYIDRIFSDVALAGNVSLVIDAGNAVTGIVAPQLFEELGCDVTPLYCDLDGTFPNHEPDPGHAENLRDLIAKVQEVGADLGVAFDGDGDRLVVVTPKGTIIWPDHLLMLFARDVLSRNPGADVLFDVKCSRQLNQVISSYGGRPIMWKTGHSQMKAKMIETGALIGGEYSGHIFIKDRWYGFDDGMYAMARLLEIITLRDQKIDEIFDAFPLLPSTPELKISVRDAEKFTLVQALIDKGDFPNGKLSTIDGLRVDFSKGWGLVRASNTSAALTLRFEAETEETLQKIQQLFKSELLKIKPDLTINF